ncbi:MAG: hypothetical protein M1516_03200 [Firmicutes bacterium]|nr:hypothetical protein [Bacillota bacterium]
MILHVGGDRSLYGRDLILILDPELGTRSGTVKQWFAALRAQGRVVETSDEPVRAWVLTDRGVWCAPVSPPTLAARARRPWS